ncbi:MAG TPA: glycosyltransferase [Thermoanaerobaculia bacterium]|nr:glycosyltransferase [Thermoanaerobaculia bacterium]
MKRLTAVVPTLGASPHLERCLAALRADAGDAVEVMLVAQEGSAAPLAARLPRGLVDRWVALDDNLGFAGGTDRGISLAATRWIATVNDDAVVEPGWTAALLAALEADPGAGAVQGVNLRLATPQVVDGWGLAWNRRWQAVQLGHGGPPPLLSSGDHRPAALEVFGVSATAAIYRREALAAAALPGGAIFDPHLGSWYEDADLANRLRAAGWRALSVPAARALHAGSLTGERAGWRRWAMVHGNRHLVLARLLGRRYGRLVGGLLLRELAAATRAAAGGRPSAALGIAAGWARAARRMHGYAHSGPPRLEPSEIVRWAPP